MTIPMLEQELKDINHEIIVVENGSIDGSVEYLEERKKDNENIKVLRFEENVGISKGKNAGIRYSIGEYLFLVDGDVRPVPNSIRMCIKYLDEHKECDALGFYPTKFQDDESHIEQHCDKLDQPKTYIRTCLYYGIFRRSVFNKCMMDETGEYGKQGYGWEDHDFYMQMKKHNIEQWATDINNRTGHYYHAINSSIKKKDCLGHAKYVETSKLRAKQYHAKWD